MTVYFEAAYYKTVICHVSQDKNIVHMMEVGCGKINCHLSELSDSCLHVVSFLMVVVLKILYTQKPYAANSDFR